MFVDASALVAIITREADAASLTDRIQRAVEPITSPLAIYEAALGISRKLKGGAGAARFDLERFLKAAGIRIVAITEQDGDRAVVTHDLYGKGSGHAARLNMGDCFAYAVAKNRGLTLLYKGNDFAQTDLA